MGNKDQSAAIKGKVIMLVVKFQLNINRVVKEITGHWNADTAAIQETLAVQPEGLSEDELININKESDCNKKNDIPEEVMPIKKTSR